MGHVKPCGNLPRPRGKTKYSYQTDSELVPWGKAEKNPGEGSEIEPETISLQSGRSITSVMRRRTFCVMAQGVIVYRKFNFALKVAKAGVGRPSPN